MGKGRGSIGDRFTKWVDKWFKTIILAIIIAVSIAAITYLAHIQAIIDRIPDITDSLIRIEDNTNQIGDIQIKLTGIEERIKDISDMKSGIDKMLGKFGIAEVTPTSDAVIAGDNVQVEIPHDSVTEPTLFTLDKISPINLPAPLPDKKYQYTDGIALSSVAGNVKANAQVKWDLAAFGSDCIDAKIFYWNTDSYKWQEVSPQTCTPTGIVGFQAETGYLYVLTKEK